MLCCATHLLFVSLLFLLRGPKAEVSEFTTGAPIKNTSNRLVAIGTMRVVVAGARSEVAEMGLNVKRLGPAAVLVAAALVCPVARAGSGCTESQTITIDNATEHFAEVTGRVLADRSANPPVPGATVTLQPDGMLATTAADGTFTLQEVPIARGYVLEIVGQAYEPVSISPIDVSGGGNDLGDIMLTPLTGVFALRQLEPVIHAGASEVEEGCTAYRYFRVVRESTNQPEGGVGIGLRVASGEPVSQDGCPSVPGWAGSKAGVSDAETGIVRLCIPATAVGPPSSTRTLETVLPDGNAGPTFEVTVTPREYEHGWTQSAGGGVNVGISVGPSARLGGGRAYSGEVTRPSVAIVDVERVANGSLLPLTFGLGVRAPIGGSANIVGAKVGITASGEIGAYAELDKLFGYGFDALTPGEATEAVLRLYCLYASAPGVIAAPPFDMFVNAVRLLVEPFFLEDYWRWSEGGFEIGGYGKLEGILGTTVGKSFAMGGSAELEGKAGVRLRYRYDALEDRWIIHSGFAARDSGNVGAGLGFRPYAGTGRPAAFKTIMNHLGIGVSTGGWLGAEQLLEIEVPDGADRPGATRLITRAGGTLAWWKLMSDAVGGTDPNESDVVAQIEVEQPISSNAEWRRAASLPGMVDLLYGTGAPLINGAFGDNLIAGLFGDHAYAKDMKFRYSAELAEPWRTEIGVSGTLVLDLGIHFEADVARTRSFELAHGIIRGGRVFPLQRTPGAAGVPSNTQSILDIQAEWLLTAAPWIEDLLNTTTWLFGGRSEEVIQLTTSAGAADLFVPAGTFPAGTEMKIDSWADEAVLTNGWMYGVGGMYRFDADVAPAGSMSLQITYLDDSVANVPEADLQIYRYDTDEQTWELVGGIVDVVANTVTAEINADGLFTIAPPMPSGQIPFVYSATLLPADGISTSTVHSGDLLLNTGAAVPDGTLFTVQANGMSIVTPDADPILDGLQASNLGGTLTVDFVAPERGGIGEFSIESVLGTAAGSGMISFEDDNAPPVVPDPQLVAGQSRIWVAWDDSGMPTDISHYRVYYSQDHAPPPFDGTARVEGDNSPVRVAGSSVLLRGLDVAAQYHIAVSAVDTSGNEGLLSDAMTVTTAEAAPSPPVSVFTTAGEGGVYEVSWSLSDDDGFNDRDVDHYEVFRWMIPGKKGVKVADVAARVSAYIDDVSALGPYALVMYEVAAVDSVGLSSERVGLPFDPDVDQDGDFDLDDSPIFFECFGGPMVAPESVSVCLDAFDTDGDGDVDLADFGVLQLMFRSCGPGVCLDDSECADGIFCNGVETCLNGCCLPGPPPCDDREFCNGEEACDEENDACLDGPDPCDPATEYCDEENDICITNRSP